MVGIPVGYQSHVSRSATITVPFRCRACGHQDTALVAGMGSGSGGGRGYGRDAASGLAGVAASEVIEKDAKQIAAAIRCPRCGAGGPTPATYRHPSVDAIRTQTVLITIAVAFFLGSPLLLMLIAGEWVTFAIMGAIVFAILRWARKRRDAMQAARVQFVDASLGAAALWSVAPQRFPAQR